MKKLILCSMIAGIIMLFAACGSTETAKPVTPTPATSPATTQTAKPTTQPTTQPSATTTDAAKASPAASAKPVSP